MLTQKEMLDILNQPPSGGCVLKQSFAETAKVGDVQPPSGGCVLKLFWSKWAMAHKFQPPSGGCVLKPLYLFSRRRL